MKRCVCLTLLLCLAQGFAVAAISRVVEVEGITQYSLDNGLRVLLAPDKSKPTTSVNVTYIVGSRMEGGGETGMAHLLEHLMFKGTPTHPQIYQELTRRGMRSNGTTWFDRTNYFETFAASPENLKWALEMEADRMVNSFIARRDLDSEMTVVRNEMERGENSAEAMLAQLVEASAFRWHQYGKSTIGARSDVENVSIDNLQALYRKYYQPDNAFVVVSGDFDPQVTLAWIERYFGAIPKPTRLLQLPYTVEPPQEGARRVELTRVGENRILEVLYHIPPAMHADLPAVGVLSEIVAATGGRLYEALVTPRKAASIGGGSVWTYDPGFAMFSASLRRGDDPAEASAVLLRTLEGLSAQPATVEEVARARQTIRSSLDRQLDDPASFGIALSQSIAVGDWRYFFWYREQIDKVTPADVMRVAKTYFRPANRTLGEFVPVAASNTTVIPVRADLSAALNALPAKSSVAVGEDFEVTPANIDAHTVRTAFDNGMQLAMLPKKTRGQNVRMKFNLRMGDDKSLANQGVLVRLIGNMLLGGSKQHSRTQLTKECEQLGSTISVNANGQSVMITVNTRRSYLPKIVPLLREILREPIFPYDELERTVRRRIGAERTATLEPATQALRALSRHLKPLPPEDVRYALDEKEFEIRANALTSQDLVEFWQSYPGGEHMWVSAVGDFDTDTLRQLLQDNFGDWRGKKPYHALTERYEDVPALTRVIEVLDKQNAELAGGMRLPVGEKDADYPALQVATHLLGGGFLNSRLAMRLRQKEGYSYNVKASLNASATVSTATLNLHAIYAPQNRARVEQAIREEIQRVYNEGFSEQELVDARKSLLQSMRLDRANDDRLASDLVRNLRLKRDLSFIAGQEERISTLKLDELNAVARKYLDPAKLSLVFAGSYGGS